MGKQLEYYNKIIWSLKTIILILGLTVAFIPLIHFIFNKISNLNNKTIAKFTNTKHLQLKVWLILVITSLIVYLAFYPGIYGYDSGYQIYQFIYRDVPITSTFSVLLSYLLYFFSNLGKILFNSYRIGFSLYILIQMLFLDFVCTKIISYVYQKNKNKYLLIIMIAFFALFPPHLILMISSCPDALCAGFIMLSLLYVFKIFVDNEQNKQNYIMLMVLLFITFCCRPNAVYSMLFFLPVLFILVRPRKKIFPLLVPIIFFLIYNGPFLNSIGVIKYNSLPVMLSIPSQQIARTINNNSISLPSKYIEEVNKFYPDYDFTVYNNRQSVSEPVIGQMNVLYTSENFDKYIKLYLQLGFKYPKTYIEAFLLNTLSLWYPNKYYEDFRMYHPYLEIDNLDAKIWNPRYIEINEDSKIPFLHNALSNLLKEHTWQNVPVVSSLFNISTYFLFLLFTLIYVLVNKNKKGIIPLSFIFSYIISVLVGPVALVRYYYPLILCWPLCIQLVLNSNDHGNK